MKRVLMIAAVLMMLLCGCGGNGEAPMSAKFADTNMIVDNMFIAEDSEYITYILFTAEDNVKDVRVYTMELNEEGLVPAEELYGAEGMKKNETLLGGVVFWGDMTTYGMSLVDSNGMSRTYELAMSGKDGSLIFSETTE